MIKPARKYCDVCGTELPIDKKPIPMPLVTDCEWTEGRAEQEHVVFEKLDLCDECVFKATNLRAGYRCSNLRIEPPKGELG